MTPGRSSAEKRLWPVPMWSPRPSPGSGSCWGWRRLYSRPKNYWPSSPQNNATGSPPRSPLLRREQEQQPSLVQHARVRQQGEDAQDVRPQDVEPRAFSQVGQSQGDFKESRSDQGRRSPSASRHVPTSRSASYPPSRPCAQLPVVDVEFAHLDGLGKLEQVVLVLLQMRRTADVSSVVVHGLHRRPVRDGGELRDVAPYPSELLHTEASRLLLDLEYAVLVVVPEVLVRKLLAGPPEPGPRDEHSP